MKPKTVMRDNGQEPGQAHSMGLGVTPGSIILTLAGETLIEDVKPGDRVITRDSGTAVVTGVSKQRLTCHAVRILAGSLGDTRPDRDVVLPADQPVLVRDWRAKALFGKRQAVARAASLVDGEFITREGIRTLTLFEIQFDAPHVIYADGLELAVQADSADIAQPKPARHDAA